jgi:hypothetical protein
MAFDTDKHTEYKTRQKQHYLSLDAVYCPALKSCVNFRADGYYHMLYKTNRQRRTVAEQHSRICLVPLLVPVLKKAKSIKETRVEQVYDDGHKTST